MMPAPLETLSIHEIESTYPSGEWLLLRVISLDEEGAIDRVDVLDRSTDRKEMSKSLKRIDRQDPTAHLCVFLAGTRLRPSGQDIREAIREAARHDYVNARW